MNDFYAIQTIRRTPVRDLSIEQVFLLELHRFMVDLRAAANEARLRGGVQWRRPHLQYLVGRIHGLVYGLSMYLISRGSIFDDAGPLDMARDSAMAEADFLIDAYLESAAWEYPR